MIADNPLAHAMRRAIVATMNFPLFVALLGSASAVLAADPITLFNGKDLSNWQAKAQQGKGANRWVAGEPRLAAKTDQLDVTGPEGAMVNLATKENQSWDIYTKEKFGSCHLEVDFLIAKGTNSGVFMMGEYEIQIADSAGKPTMGKGDMGAVDGVCAPYSNAAKKPGEWQHLVIDWQAPTFDASGAKTANGRFLKVELNGVVIHVNVEVTTPKRDGITGKESPTGPVMFQGTHSPVAFRNIKITASN
jgi:hypothetical protein